MNTVSRPIRFATLSVFVLATIIFSLTGPKNSLIPGAGNLGIDQEPFIPGTYVLDQSRSNTSWEADRTFATTHHEGDIEAVTVSVIVNRSGAIMDGLATFDLQSITVTEPSNEERAAQLLGHLQSPDFFDVEQFPLATYDLGQAIPNDKIPGFTLNGNATIKGITVGLPAGVPIEQLDDNTLHIQTPLAIDRTLFDITYGSQKLADMAKDAIIDDVFTLHLDWYLVKQ